MYDVISLWSFYCLCCPPVGLKWREHSYVLGHIENKYCSLVEFSAFLISKTKVKLEVMNTQKNRRRILLIWYWKHEFSPKLNSIEQLEWNLYFESWGRKCQFHLDASWWDIKQTSRYFPAGTRLSILTISGCKSNNYSQCAMLCVSFVLKHEYNDNTVVLIHILRMEANLTVTLGQPNVQFHHRKKWTPFAVKKTIHRNELQCWSCVYS